MMTPTFRWWESSMKVSRFSIFFIEILLSLILILVKLPHMRQHCTKHKFVPNSTISNSKFCDLCYCFVCDIPAKECKVRICQFHLRHMTKFIFSCTITSIGMKMSHRRPRHHGIAMLMTRIDSGCNGDLKRRTSVRLKLATTTQMMVACLVASSNA